MVNKFVNERFYYLLHESPKKYFDMDALFKSKHAQEKKQNMFVVLLFLYATA